MGIVLRIMTTLGVKQMAHTTADIRKRYQIAVSLDHQTVIWISAILEHIKKDLAVFASHFAHLAR